VSKILEILTHQYSLKNKLLGKSEKSRMLINVFKEYNRKVAALVGNGYAPGTLTRYEHP